MVRKRRMIYVIDDDESVRRSFRRLFRSADFEVEIFSSAEEFLSGPRQKEDACILIDLHMSGSSGFDLQRKLAEQGIRTPVIVVSASDDAQTREHARELGAVSFFRKPVDDQALIDAIHWAMGVTKNKSGPYDSRF